MPDINAPSRSGSAIQGEVRHSAKPPIIDELDVETADGRRFPEHLGLQLTGLIPCWLAAHRGIEGKDQPATAPAFSARAKRFDLVEKTINLRARRRGRTGLIV